MWCYIINSTSSIYSTISKTSSYGLAPVLNYSTASILYIEPHGEDFEVYIYRAGSTVYIEAVHIGSGSISF